MAKRHVKYRAEARGERSEAFKAGDKVVGYFRDSGGVNQDRSVDEQVLIWRKALVERKLEAGRVFEDRAKSGKTARGRVAYREMFEYFESGEAKRDGVRGLLLLYYSRFAREFDDFQFYISSIRRAGYVVQSISDQIPEGDFSRVMEAFVAWKDMMYSRDLGKHIKRGQEMILNNYRDDGGLYELPGGEKVQLSAGGRPPVGYERAQVATGKNRAGAVRYNAYWFKTKDEDLARRVWRAWEMMLDGQSYKEIEEACKLGLGKNSYNDFFSTVTYTGTYQYGDFERRGAFEPYVTWDEWEQAQAVIESRGVRGGRQARKPGNQKYLLSGMVRCGSCGQAWHGVHSTRAGRNDIYYYECGSRYNLKKACGLGRVRAESLEALVLEGIIETLDLDKLYELAGKLEALKREQRSREERPISELKAQIGNDNELIKTLILKQATVGARLGVEDQYDNLILEARLRRDKAQAELEKLLVNREEMNPAILQFNLEKLNDVRSLLRGLQALSQPSGRLGNEVFKPVRDLFEIFGVKIMLYGALDGSAKGSVGVSLDLGSLAYYEMSSVTEGGPSWIRTSDLSIMSRLR